MDPILSGIICGGIGIIAGYILGVRNESKFEKEADESEIKLGVYKPKDCLQSEIKVRDVGNGWVQYSYVWGGEWLHGRSDMKISELTKEYEYVPFDNYKENRIDDPTRKY